MPSMETELERGSGGRRLASAVIQEHYKVADKALWLVIVFCLVVAAVCFAVALVRADPAVLLAVVPSLGVAAVAGGGRMLISAARSR